MRNVVLATVTILVAALGNAAEVYRSVNADGNVSYSDRPVDATSEPIFIATPRPATPPPVVASAEPPAPTAGAAEPAADAEPEPAPPTAQELAAERAANCEIARERNDRYQTSRRLYRTTPDGEREYLSDAELDAARAGAAADVEKWCD